MCGYVLSARLTVMTNNTMPNFAASSHSVTDSAADTPVPAPQSTAERNTRQPVLISVAKVTFGTAATHPTRVRRRWLDPLRRLRTGSLEARSAKRTRPARRDDYLENAAMAREMHRL